MNAKHEANIPHADANDKSKAASKTFPDTAASRQMRRMFLIGREARGPLEVDPFHTGTPRPLRATVPVPAHPPNPEAHRGPLPRPCGQAALPGVFGGALSQGDADNADSELSPLLPPASTATASRCLYLLQVAFSLECGDKKEKRELVGAENFSRRVKMRQRSLQV